MLFPSVCGALVVSYAAVAAAADGSSIGTVQVLNYNNLGPENNGTAALLVYDGLSHDGASSACKTAGESLLPYSQLHKDNTTELQQQLDYLVATGSLKSNDSLWVGSSKCESQCLAYSINGKKTTPLPCASKLPALCSSKVPPTTDKNRNPTNSSKVTVAYNDYQYTGYRDKRSFRFLGIPFADPPVKKLRFMAPQNYTGSNKIEATKLSAACMQAKSPYGESDNNSEDCLYLNVYTPIVPGNASRASSRRPVAVYFYGGAFVEGAASLIDYDGGNFASRNDVVIVTVNYRLGPLGYLATESLVDGSLGIKDQVQALRWVRDSIAAFGGDPKQVTIFGQSAGGQSTVALLSSSAAKGLFHGAIVESAPVDLPWFTRGVYSKLITPSVAAAVGCNGTKSEKDLVACLQEKPASSFLTDTPAMKQALSDISDAVSEKYLNASKLLASIEPFLPMIDDSKSGVIDDQFDKLIKNGSLPSHVPVMFTFTKDEAILFVNNVLSSPVGSSQTALDSALSLAFAPELGKKIVSSGAFKTNTSDSDSVRNTLGDILTASEWSCPQAYLLDNAGNNTFPAVYSAQITDGHQQTNVSTTSTCLRNDNFNATCHTSDVLPVWGNLNSKTKGVEPYYGNDDILHSQLMNDVWGAFIKSGNPNPDVKILKTRGLAYASTAKIFGQDKYEINKYAKGAKQITSLGMPPSKVANPGLSKQCAVFTDYGYTFQHAKLSA